MVTSNGTTWTKIFSSLSRRALSGSVVSDQVDSANGVKRASTEGDILQDQLNPYNNPDQAVKDAFRQVAANSEDW